MLAIQSTAHKSHLVSLKSVILRFCTEGVMSVIFVLVATSLCFASSRHLDCADPTVKRECEFKFISSPGGELVSLPFTSEKMNLVCDEDVQEEIADKILKRLGLSRVPKEFNGLNISNDHFVFDEFLSSYEENCCDETHRIALFPFRVNNTGKFIAMDFNLYDLPAYLNWKQILSAEIIFYDETQNARNDLYTPFKNEEIPVWYFSTSTKCSRILGSFSITDDFPHWDIRETRFFYKVEVGCAENCNNGPITISTEKSKLPYMKILLSKTACSKRVDPTVAGSIHTSNRHDMVSCFKQIANIDFAAIGWGKWLIFPKVYTDSHCVGSCHSPGRSANKACKPDDMLPAFFIYWEGNTLIGQEVPDMLAETCACV